MSEKRIVGTYWIYPAGKPAEEHRRIDVVASIMGETQPRVRLVENGVEVHYTGGSWTFYPYAQTASVFYEPKDAK